MRNGPSAISDGEFVERVRRGLAWWDRFRWLFLALYLGGAAAVVGMVLAMDAFVRGRALPGMGVGFGVGLGLGALLGLQVFTVTHGLVNALTRGGRAHRLLVRYYDAARETRAAPAAEEEAELVPSPAPSRDAGS